LSDINLEEIHVHVTSVRRSGISGPAPEPGTVLQVGDVLVLYGSSEALEQAEKLLLEG
jgi:K+/H+ antiporter YhaU regulatory subunit KhtT